MGENGSKVFKQATLLWFTDPRMPTQLIVTSEKSEASGFVKSWKFLHDSASVAEK